MSETKTISPRDVITTKFTKSMWGYSPTEVVQFLEEVSKQYEDSLKRVQELEKNSGELHQEIQSWKLKEKEIFLLRENALKETEMIREQAMQEAQKHFAEVENKAKEIRENTERWLSEVIGEVEKAEQQRNSFVTAFKSALDSHYAILGKEESGEPLTSQLQKFLREGVRDKLPT